MDEERMKILKMLEEGKITAEEAARLLEALEASSRRESPPPERWVPLKVTDMRTGRQRVNVNIPLHLINLGFSIGARFSPKWEEILEKIRVGARGKIVDVEDEEEGEKVEIYIE